MRSRIAVDDFYQRKLGLSEAMENEIELLSRRNIKILRGNDTIYCDLEKFKVNGNTNYNPYIHQEDIVHIPYKENFVTIKGGVQKPGKYEYKNINMNVNMNTNLNMSMNTNMSILNSLTK